MENLTLEMAAFLVGSGFIAAFIDSVVGGGGLISLPALLFTGLPPAFALGTNKLASTLCSVTSMTSFIRSGKVDLKLVKYLFPLSFVGAALGAYVVRLLPPDFLKPLVAILLVVVAVYTLFKKEWGHESTYQGMNKRVAALSGISAFALGFYDGFFGPGTGSFLIFAFLFIGFDFVQSAGNAKVLNFASNIAALLMFGFMNSINYHYGLLMGAGMFAGALVGSRVAIKQGATYVRPLFITVTGLLISKQVLDLFH